MANAPTRKKLLHVGCGFSRIDMTTRGFAGGGWEEIRLDIDAAVAPDIIGSMTDMHLVKDASIDAIFSSHNIEHLYPHDVPVALKEFLRVLKDDGFLVLTCPDLQSTCALVAQDNLTGLAFEAPGGPISPIDILYGHRGFMAEGRLYMAHRCGFTERTLREALIANGFKSTVTMCRPSVFDLWAIGAKSRTSREAMNLLVKAHLPV